MVELPKLINELMCSWYVFKCIVTNTCNNDKKSLNGSNSRKITKLSLRGEIEYLHRRMY